MNTELLSDTSNEDSTAYAELYLDYSKKLYNYGKKFTENVTLIQDSVQELFLDIWSKKDKLKETTLQASYYYSSFRYILFRKLKQSNKIVHSAEFDTDPEFSTDHFIISRETSDELKLKIEKALKTLTARQREAIFLRFYEGLSYDEVALVLNISTKATYKIMARSLSALKDAMQFPVTTFLLLASLKA